MKRKLKFSIIIPLVLIGAFIFCGTSTGNRVTLIFTGDIIMHIPVKSCAASRNELDKNKKSLNHAGFGYLFERIAPALSSADITCGNMEFPVSHPYNSVPWEFNCRPEVLDAMRSSGFTMMHIANNHVLDQGEKGIVNTIGYLKAKNIDYIGADISEAAARGGIIKEFRGVRVGLIGYTGVMNYPFPKNPKGYHINDFNDLEKVKGDVAALKKKCGLVVVVAHIGEEYALTPSKKTREAAKEIADAGADIIIGHHPHVIQPFEKIITPDKRECLVFYSLGNFISNQSGVVKSGKNERLSTRDSGLVKIIYTAGGIIGKNKVSAEIIPIMTLNDRDENGKRRIQTVEMKEEIGILEKRIENSKSAAEKRRIKQRVDEIKARRSAVKNAFYKYAPLNDVVFAE